MRTRSLCGRKFLSAITPPQGIESAERHDIRLRAESTANHTGSLHTATKPYEDRPKSIACPAQTSTSKNDNAPIPAAGEVQRPNARAKTLRGASDRGW